MASTYQMPVDVVCEDGFVPEYKHDGDAGADLRAHIDGPLTIQPGESAWVPTGVRLAIPDGHVGLQFPRSGRCQTEVRRRSDGGPTEPCPSCSTSAASRSRSATWTASASWLVQGL